MQAAGTISAPGRLVSLVEDYLAHCRAAGLSPKTIRHAYGYPVRAVFVPWCAGHEVTEPGQLTSRAWIALSATCSSTAASAAS